MVTKILVISSSTGAGHDTMADAFQAWVKSDAGRELELEIEIEQALEDSAVLFRFGVWLYNSIQRNAPLLHHVYYNFLQLVGVSSKSWKIPNSDQFVQLVRDHAPDVVLSMHDHLNHGFFELVRTVGTPARPRCITYFHELHGGYGFDRWWVNPDSDFFIGATEETCEAARRRGMSDDRVWHGGFMLHPQFYEQPLSAETRVEVIRRELQFDPERFILLLATGGAGANNHLRLLQRLLKENLRPQVIALCGKDPETKRAVEEFSNRNGEIPVRAIGYTSDMSTWIQCSDAIVARPGVGTTSEAIMRACPILFNGLGGTMPQELATIRYCNKHGIGLPFGSPRRFVKQLRSLMEHPATVEAQRRNMRAVRPARSPLEIVAKIASLAGDRLATRA